VADVDDENRSGLVVDAVDDAVGTDARSPVIRAAGELTGPGGARIVGETVDARPVTSGDGRLSPFSAARVRRTP